MVTSNWEDFFPDLIYFKGQQGVRWGDSLSLFLFTLVDVPSQSCIGVERGILGGLMIGSEGLEVSHLQFANYTNLFLCDNEESFQNVLWLLQIFQVLPRILLIF